MKAEGQMFRSVLEDVTELASLGVFMAMIGLAAKALGGP